ncbi:glycosyltransferase family 39 protein [bacterium]|nr:glycosyltransferase family 39 protein [candidate division CSSED10-310 bacterium]
MNTLSFNHSRPPVSQSADLLVMMIIICMAVIAFVGTAIINNRYLERIPHVQDSVNYWFQAQLYGMGRTWIEAPENVEYFASEHIVVQNNRWYCHYPFLVPLLFMIGMKFGYIWLVNPLIAALSVLLIGRICVEHFSRQSAVWAAVFLVSSPFFLVMSASFMSHPLGLLLTAACIYAGLRQLKNPSTGNAILLGAAIGLLFNTRPLTSFAVSLPIISFHIRNRDRFNGKVLRHLFIMGFIALIGVGLFLLYSSHLSGKTLQFATHTAVNDVKGPTSIKIVNRFFNSFAAAGVGKTGHTPERGLGCTKALIELLHTFAMNWPGWLNFSFFLIPLIPWRRREEDLFLYWTFLSIPLWYSLYWRSAIMYGPRYIYEVMPMVVILSARGMDVCMDAAGWIHRNSPMRHWKTLTVARSATAICLWVFTGWLVYTDVDQYVISDYYDMKKFPVVSLVPMRLSAMNGFNGVRRSIQDQVEKWNVTDAVVFVEDRRWQGFGSVSSFNHPRMDTDVVYARDKGQAGYPLILKMFPGKKAYWIAYPRAQLHTLEYNPDTDQYVKTMLKEQ